MGNRRSVDICVTTFRRPVQLGQLLESLLSLRAAEVAVRIVVVDNDGSGSGRDVVESFRHRIHGPIVYDIEPRKNIAHARNRAISHVEGAYFAFLDDDETVCADWLRAMLDACDKYDADVVFGPVDRVLPPDAPAWTRGLSVFTREHHTTGAAITHGGTGNTFFKTAALGTPPMQFDPAYGLTGGEDSDFFRRMSQARRKFVWCEEAVAYEPVPRDRLRVQWIWKRSFRSGQSYYRVFVAGRRPFERVLWLLRNALQLTAAILALPVARVVSYRRFAEVSAAACRASGQLSAALFRRYYKEYDASSSS